MTGTPELTRERVISLLDYDPLSGLFLWKWREDAGRGVNERDAGQVAGTSKDGYVVVMIDGKQYRAHRLAHLIVTGNWPERDVDHWDLDRANNAWGNIRPATRSQNHGNKRKRVDNTSGYKGVIWSKAHRKWRAKIQVEGRYIHLGMFDLILDAAAAYNAAAIQYFGAFARFD